MAIVLDADRRVFTLHTRNSTYQMKADELDVLLHTYYGERSDDTDKSYLICRVDRGFSGNPYEIGKTDRGYSLDILPQEYSCFGTGDYRTTALRVRWQDGSQAARLRYEGYERMDGKYEIPGLPAVYAKEEEGQTLVLRLRDRESGLKVELWYGVLESLDVITRAVRISNEGAQTAVLEKAASLNLDFPYGKLQWLTFYGRHAMEQNVQRKDIAHGLQAVGSVRGISSHQYNPFVMLCEEKTGEETGSCYGCTLLYSGEFLMETELDQMGQTRLVGGIHPDDFSWRLEPGEALWLPETVLTYSNQGFGGISRSLHRTIRRHVCRGFWRDRRRPVLINNWEATYFDFRGKQLEGIAKDAGKLGIELFVMDDGWFGKREDDNSGLGDWEANEKKLGCTLREFGERITAAGMRFGIWMEPEGLSEDSDLYRAHPDWAVRIPGRLPVLARNQLVLDLSRREVQDYLIGKISQLLSSAPISYVKWDMNRALCDKFSAALPPERQGEFAHRYVLGLYRVLETVTGRFPKVLFEGCCGGGGRFDAGMLFYTPQIWGSDNTDAIERLSIQYGASFCYPVSVMGAHVSAVPNHQTGRMTPLATRGHVAMAGTFGYELDLTRLSGEERKQVRKQIEGFKNYCELIQRGDYYRLLPPEGEGCTAWEVADPSGREALITAVYHHVRANAPLVRLLIRGLLDEADYRLRIEGNHIPSRLPYGFGPGEKLTGAALRTCGLILPEAQEEYQAWQIYVWRLEE